MITEKQLQDGLEALGIRFHKVSTPVVIVDGVTRTLQLYQLYAISTVESVLEQARVQEWTDVAFFELLRFSVIDEDFGSGDRAKIRMVGWK